MPIPEQNTIINLSEYLVDLSYYRIADRLAGGKPDALIVHVAYAQDNLVYQDGKIVAVDEKTYESYKKSQPNELVNKFTQVYCTGMPLLLHKRLADVLIDTAIDMRNRYGQFTVVMDGLRTYDSGRYMDRVRPDLVEAKLLAPAGTSAHNRALAVDSKLFELADPSLLDADGRLRTDAAARGVVAGKIPLHLLREADEKGHLDDLDMTTANRFFKIAPSEAAYKNRLHRLQAWQRASVKNKLPIANLIAEFWDDRVPGSPADMWRVLTCRAMCLEKDGNPKTNPVIQVLRTNLETLHKAQEQGNLTRQQFADNAQVMLATAWEQMFSLKERQQLEELLGAGASMPPATRDFIFHEWLENIHDHDLVKAGLPPQARETALQMASGGASFSPQVGRILH